MKITKEQRELHKFTAKSRIRPEFSGVYTDGVSAMATDSFRLVKITNNAAGIVADNPIIIDATLLKQVKASGDVEIVKEGDSLYASGNVGKFLIETLARAEDYSKCDTLIQEAEAREYMTITINGAYLAEIAAHLAKLSENQSITIHMPKVTNRPLLITASGGTQVAKALLTPLNK